MIKKALKRTASLWILMGCICAAVSSAGAVQTSASASILMDADSGYVFCENHADEERLIASTTKIMTAVIALENASPDDVVQITGEHMAEGSSMYLKPGERVTMEALLYGLMLSSGNDAALAIADHCGPGVPAFVEKMNQKARELGLLHTSYANPNGLDAPGHYSSARDLAVLTAYAMRHETFSQIVSTKRITIGGRTLVNHNKLLSRYEGCVGVKTGYTRAAGRTLVSCASRNGLKLIAVTLNDRNDWADHAALYDDVFSKYQRISPAIQGKAAGTVQIINGVLPRVQVEYGESYSGVFKTDDQLEVRREMRPHIFAPAAEGDVAGYEIYLLNGVETGRVPLILSDAAARLPIEEENGLLRRMIRRLEESIEKK